MRQQNPGQSRGASHGLSGHELGAGCSRMSQGLPGPHGEEEGEHREDRGWTRWQRALGTAVKVKLVFSGKEAQFGVTVRVNGHP